MTIGFPCFQIPRDKVNQCINSGICASAMIATCDITTLATKYAIGHITTHTGISLALLPFVGARIFQHVIPETDAAAIYIGAAYGMGATILIGPDLIGYATGSVVGGLAAATLAAVRARVLRPLPQAS